MSLKEAFYFLPANYQRAICYKLKKKKQCSGMKVHHYPRQGLPKWAQ